MKKTWEKPEVKSLEVAMTEYGSELKKNPDAVITVGKYTFYSFS
ncbi:paeninodin family lasso peptide [Paenibacillus methanolicus]|uniref:Uncharacterized protein n=1 Tax=Paenibacillus methanolicus TaxID=582686 RepID=A0A5S5BRZ4_9BACL|nr:paeninodin family lasso peptide [Paenibacillus methanolicus]TYP69138.1 hypothetical protein BCM02_11614 [Paenibacillus methanolicus]